MNASFRLREAAPNRNRTVGIAITAVAAVVILAVAVYLFIGWNYKGTVDKYIKASMEGNGSNIISLLPDEVLEKVYEESDMTRREFLEYADDALESTLDMLNSRLGNWSYSYTITEEEDYSKSDLKALKLDYEDEFDIKVEAAKRVTVKLTVKGDEDTETSNSMVIYLVKIGNLWYLDAASMGGLF